MLQSGLRRNVVLACDRGPPGCRTNPRACNVGRRTRGIATQQRYAEIRVGACPRRDYEAPGLWPANSGGLERRVRCTTERRRFLILYAAPADVFLSIGYP